MGRTYNYAMVNKKNKQVVNWFFIDRVLNRPFIGKGLCGSDADGNILLEEFFPFTSKKIANEVLSALIYHKQLSTDFEVIKLYGVMMYADKADR